MSKVIIAGVLGGVFGFLLASQGFTVLTWQFWAFLATAFLMVINA